MGDTLHVDTVGIRRHPDRWKTPHSGKIHIKWEIERVASDRAPVHVTLFDDEAFTEPMVTTNIWRRKSGPRWEVLDDGSCFENNRNLPESNGATGFKPF